MMKVIPITKRHFLPRKEKKINQNLRKPQTLWIGLNERKRKKRVLGNNTFLESNPAAAAAAAAAHVQWRRQKRAPKITTAGGS